MSTDACSADNNRSAHLVLRDNERDFAIFCLDMHQSPHSDCLDLHRNFPGVDRLDFQTQLANRRVFAIGYNSRVRADDFPQVRQRVTANVTRDKQSRSQEVPITGPSDFEDVFLPNRKTLSIGRLQSDSTQKPETMGWKHGITEWYGISGAMIACIDSSSTEGTKVQVLGLCKIIQTKSIT
jgi:hypothetical protein